MKKRSTEVHLKRQMIYTVSQNSLAEGINNLYRQEIIHGKIILKNIRFTTHNKIINDLQKKNIEQSYDKIIGKIQEDEKSDLNASVYQKVQTYKNLVDKASFMI